jgi:4-hydroxy-tetrahydrodipicolinate reductase
VVKVCVLGAGRMGREVLRTVASTDDVELAGLWIRRGAAPPNPVRDLLGCATVSDSLDEVLKAADVAVDFSLPDATAQVLHAAVKAATPLVCGVSGLREADIRLMQCAAGSIPIVYDRNMSLGIAVLKDLVSRAAPLLGDSFVAEIRETHHVHKKDAPSGTALALGEVLASSRHQDFSAIMRYSAEGRGTRTKAADIVFSVTRTGEVPGEHTVAFRSDAESLELTHKVSDRRVFASGALQAARWLVQQRPGLYQMSDFLTNISA